MEIMNDKYNKEFINCLIEIKKLLVNFQKSDRLKINSWVKALCLPTNNISWKRNRNLYILKLLDNMMRGRLEEPFTKFTKDDEKLPLMDPILVRSQLKSQLIECMRRGNFNIPLNNVEIKNNNQSKGKEPENKENIDKNNNSNEKINIDNENNNKNNKIISKEITNNNMNNNIFNNNIRYFENDEYNQRIKKNKSFSYMKNNICQNNNINYYDNINSIENNINQNYYQNNENLEINNYPNLDVQNYSNNYSPLTPNEQNYNLRKINDGDKLNVINEKQNSPYKNTSLKDNNYLTPFRNENKFKNEKESEKENNWKTDQNLLSNSKNYFTTSSCKYDKFSEEDKEKYELQSSIIFLENESKIKSRIIEQQENELHQLNQRLLELESKIKNIYQKNHQNN